MQEVSQPTLSKRARLDHATYSMTEVCGLFNLGYTTVWTLVQADKFPVTPIKCGRQYRFAKVKVDRLLGLDGHREGDVADAQ